MIANYLCALQTTDVTSQEVIQSMAKVSAHLERCCASHKRRCGRCNHSSCPLSSMGNRKAHDLVTLRLALRKLGVHRLTSEFMRLDPSLKGTAFGKTQANAFDLMCRGLPFPCEVSREEEECFLEPEDRDLATACKIEYDEHCIARHEVVVQLIERLPCTPELKAAMLAARGTSEMDPSATVKFVALLAFDVMRVDDASQDGTHATKASAMLCAVLGDGAISANTILRVHRERV